MPDGTKMDAAGMSMRPTPGSSAAAGGKARRRVGPALSGRLFALVAAIAFPLLALSAWAVWTAHVAVRQETGAALTQRARGIALAVEREFERGEALLQALAASSALSRGDLGLVEEEMRAAARALGGPPVSLIGARGTVLLSTVWALGERHAGTPAPAEVLGAIAAGGSRLTPLFQAPLTGLPTVAVVVPTPGSAATSGLAEPPTGIVLGFARERVAASLRAASGLGQDGAQAGWTASIIDTEGISVARTAGEGGIVGRPARPETARLFAATPEGLLEARTREGVPAVSAFVRGGRSGYTYVLTMPAAEFTAPLDAALLRMLAGGGLVVALGFALAAMLARQTVRAFRAARAAAFPGAAPGPTGLREADDLAGAIAAATADRDRAEAALVASERRNREVLESLGERLFALDRDGRIRFASRAALQAWGLVADEILGRRFEEALPANIGSANWIATMTALRERQELHLCGISPVLGRWVELDAYPSADGGLTVAFRDIEALRNAHRERARAAAALRGSEERLRLALEAAELGTWEVELRTGTVRRSPRTLEILGFGPEAALEPYRGWRSRIHPDDRLATEAAIDAALAGVTEAYRVEYRHQRPDGAWIWIESHGRVVARDPATGVALRLAGTSRDVAARKAAEERQALLAREVDHRAKNALAVVQAAMRLTPKEDPVAFARAIEGRVNALARAQTLLAAERWNSADLRGLIEGELAPFLAPREGVPAAVLSGPRVALPAGAAQPVAMAVHELATNAVKHGALSRAGGQLLVYWSLDTAPAVPRLLLRWVERGGPPVGGEPARRGFGSRVLEGTVRGQLGGSVTLGWDPAGLVCEISVPLRPPRGEEAALQAAGQAAR